MGAKLLKKVLSMKQGENRLNKYCDTMDNIDQWGFYGNVEHATKVIYDMELGNKRMHLTIDLKTGIIKEVVL